MKYLIYFLIVVIIVIGLMGCSSSGKKKYNPITTIIRVVTGNFK